MDIERLIELAERHLFLENIKDDTLIYEAEKLEAWQILKNEELPEKPDEVDGEVWMLIRKWYNEVNR